MKLTQKKLEILRIIADFDANKVDWTLNQFEQEFFHYSNKGNVKEVSHIPRPGYNGELDETFPNRGYKYR